MLDAWVGQGDELARLQLLDSSEENGNDRAEQEACLDTIRRNALADQSTWSGLRQTLLEVYQTFYGQS